MDADKCTEFDRLPETQLKNGIWWLASFPKSGSTWVRMFLNAAVTRFPVDINAAFQYISGDLTVGAYQTCTPLPFSMMGVREAIYLRPASLLAQLTTQPNRDICLKTHHANVHVDNIPMCPPKLSKGAVYIVRDPRDVAVSFAKHMGVDINKAIDLMGNAQMCIHRNGSPLYHYISTWSNHVRSWLSQDNPIPISCIRYEDMLTSPQETFQKIVDGLGLTKHVDQEALEFGLEQSRFDKLKNQEQQSGFRETGTKQKTFFNAGQAGGWRDKLTTDQVRRIEREHRDVMEELGYFDPTRNETQEPELLQASN